MTFLDRKIYANISKKKIIEKYYTNYIKVMKKIKFASRNIFKIYFDFYSQNKPVKANFFSGIPLKKKIISAK